MMNKYIKSLTSALLVPILILSLNSCGMNSASKSLDAWSDNSPNKQRIITFVKEITDRNSKNFVPEEDRIATFDMDGTIACEQPLWIELASAEYKIMNDMKDRKGLVAEVAKLNKDLKQSPEPSETGQLIDDVTSQAFLNMSEEDYVNYVQKFMSTNKIEFTNLQYKDTFYKPMLELIDYLMLNKFQVYIVSGSERGSVWGACMESIPDIPRSHEIGSDIVLKPLNQTDPSDNQYIYAHDDNLIRQGNFSQKDLKLGKVYNIYHQIGQKPILAFGNTDGDFSMLNYAKSNKYKSISFLLCHDDNSREYDYNVNQRAQWDKEAKSNGWNVVSMKNEFKQIFLKETTKK